MASQSHLCWAKVQTWPWWPGKVLQQGEDGKKLVLFLVDNQVGGPGGLAHLNALLIDRGRQLGGGARVVCPSPRPQPRQHPP